MQKICSLKNIGKNSAKNMHYCICTFGGCQFFQKINKTSRKVHIFCIFSAYFLHISLKIKENCQKLAICKKYALFQKYLGKVKIVKNCKKPREKCIFFAYFIKNQRKLPKIGDMQKICRKYALFQKYLGKVKIVKNCKKPREKCIFSAFCIFFAYRQFLAIFFDF